MSRSFGDLAVMQMIVFILQYNDVRKVCCIFIRMSVTARRLAMGTFHEQLFINAALLHRFSFSTLHLSAPWSFLDDNKLLIILLITIIVKNISIFKLWPINATITVYDVFVGHRCQRRLLIIIMTWVCGVVYSVPIPM